jgi:lambda family phage portal protein
MNLTERVLVKIAPGWALSRFRARETFKAYEAAKPGRLHKANATHKSGDVSATEAGRSLRGQARYLEENSDMIDGLLSVLVNNVVGKEGIGVEPMPQGFDGEVHDAFAKELAEGFAEWSLKCDSTGQWSRAELERLACRAWLRDGECLGEHILGKVPNFTHPNGVVPFSIQAMESDFLPFDLTQPAKGIAQAIETNAWGQALNFHVYLHHPGSMAGYTIKTRPVPAGSMMHIKLVKRLHQRRGVSILASSMARISGLQNYEESELVAARIAAAMAFYIRKGEPNDYDANATTAAGTRKTLAISPGTIFDDLKPGEDVGTIESKRPNALMQKFRDTMFRAICAATGANFSTTAKQYDGTFSAQRQELVESYVSYGVLSDAFIAQWSRRVYRQYVHMSILSGRHTVPGEVDPDTVMKAYYQPPVMPWIDPLKEAKGFTEIVKGGFGTESEVVRSRGKNPEEVHRQRKREILRNRDDGLVFSSDSFHQYYASKNNAKGTSGVQSAA